LVHKAIVVVKELVKNLLVAGGDARTPAADVGPCCVGLRMCKSRGRILGREVMACTVIADRDHLGRGIPSLNKFAMH